MKPRYTGEFIAKVLRAIRLEGEIVLGQFRAPCPYHEDRNPSWSIRLGGQRAGLHFCWSCKEGGTLAELVQQVKGLDDLAEAEAWLRVHMGDEEAEPTPMAFEVDVRPPGQRGPFRFPPGVEWERPLSCWPTTFRDYAASRDLTEEQVRDWGLGYGAHGRLAGRLVLPVYTHAGALASYQARLVHGVGQRYLYPAPREGADMSAMFGEAWWPAPALRCDWPVYVTEGILDALAVQRCAPDPDVAAVAALGGSRLRAEHAMALSMFGEVVVVTDGDEAGDRIAAEIAASLARHTKVRRVRLPDGEDPSSLAQAAPHLLGAALVQD